MQKFLFKKALRNHSLAMIICCAVPLTLFVILSLRGTVGSWAFYGLVLLCPLLHIVMMRGHSRTPDHIRGHAPSGDEERRAIAPPNTGKINKRSRTERL
jgi:hypothetical protein